MPQRSHQALVLSKISLLALCAEHLSQDRANGADFARRCRLLRFCRQSVIHVADVAPTNRLIVDEKPSG
jgi:hypothetical protein